MKKYNIDNEIVISSFLRGGMAVSAVVIITGLLMFFLTGKSGYSEGYYPVNTAEIIRGLAELKSYAVIMCGLFLLILLPVARVILSFCMFYLEKDFLYMKITAVVISVLLFSFIIVR